MGTEQAPNVDEEIDRKKSDGSYELTDAERKEKKRVRQANGNAYINLQLSCEELPYDLVSLAKTEELPDGCTRDAWERLTSGYDLTEGEDKLTLLTMFQQNQLEDVRTNITFWLTSLAIQVNKLKKLHHVLDEEYQITHILASLPRDDRIPSTTPGAEPPRDARDSGSARSHSKHLETSSSNRP